MFRNLFLLITSVVLVSCQPDVVSPLDMGTDYMNVELGNWWEYKVDSNYTDDFFSPPLDTGISFLLKEVLADTMRDNSGRLSYRIERFKKMFNDSIPYDSISWSFTDVWYCTPTDRTFERIEENIRFVRLNFPVEDGRNWDGNVYNTYQEWDYNYQNVHVAYEVEAGVFDSTLLVEQRNNINFLDNEVAHEIYAIHVGLIYKHITDQVLNISSGVVQSGSSMTWELIDYGN